MLAETRLNMTPTKAINFTGPNLRKSLDGLKNQTRRQTELPGENFAVGWYHPTVVPKGIEEPGEKVFGVYDLDGQWGKKTRYQPGDILAMRTTWAVHKRYDEFRPCGLPFARIHRERLWFASDGDKPDWAGKSRPAMFLPKALWHLCPRIEITKVRIERLNALSDEDAIAEGIIAENVVVGVQCYGGPTIEETANRYFRHDGPDEGYECPVDAFADSWDSINGKGSWESNPFVFAYDYKLCEVNHE